MLVRHMRNRNVVRVRHVPAEELPSHRVGILVQVILRARQCINPEKQTYHKQIGLTMRICDAALCGDCDGVMIGGGQCHHSKPHDKTDECEGMCDLAGAAGCKCVRAKEKRRHESHGADYLRKGYAGHYKTASPGKEARRVIGSGMHTVGILVF